MSIGGVQRLEDLGLDLVERLDGGRVDRFKLFVVEGGNRKTLEVGESGLWRKLLRKDEMLERNGVRVSDFNHRLGSVG